MNPRSLSWHEIVAAIGGGLLAVSLWLPWYHAANQRATELPSKVPPSGKDFTAWQVHDIQRYLFLAAAAAPFILAYIIIRGHKLSWARGELTAVVAIAAFGLIGYAGLISKPGEPNGLMSLKWGWVVAMVGV